MSFDPDADAAAVAETGTEQALSLEDTMQQILLVLKKIELHLSSMTDEEIEDDDVH